ncbi:hypothetical protein M407DRAFT_23893 [Tulasnella calospora MUT 4182]|uniref:Uncharacterized protein n=1 Tax=Tulasnella calospora MUT 4182 TaxID=1051891 RepID=A0A0C3LZP2_9AGAM|nr:hypothetical protein M407DRAFT_23893 [Tulasnella calospora MUT 4182]
MSVLGASENQFTTLTYRAEAPFNEAPPTLFLEGLAFEEFTPDLFRGVQVLKMVNTVVRNSFVNEVCALICISRNIIELHLQSITVEEYGDNMSCDIARQSSDQLPDERCLLSTVRLIGLHPSIATKILGLLANCRLEVLEVDSLDPECLSDPTGVVSAILKELGGFSPSLIPFTIRRQKAYFNLRSHAAPGHLGRSENDNGYKLESGRVVFFAKKASDWKTLLDSSSALGIWGSFDRVEVASSLDRSYPTTLGHAKRMIVELNSAVSALGPLGVASYDALGLVQYPCPPLEEIIFVESNDAEPESVHDDKPFQELCKVVSWRQHVAHHAKRIAKLRRLGVPYNWIERIERAQQNYPAFHGIEVYDTNDNRFS